MKEDIPMVFLWEGNMSVVRVRSVVLIREGIEGRKEGGRDSSHICAFRPVHSAAFDTPSFIVARPFFNSIHFLSFSLFLLLFQRRKQGPKRRIIFFSTRGRTDGDMRTTTAGRRQHVLSISHVFIDGREGELGGRVCAYHIYPSSSSAKQAKQRKTENWRKREKKKKKKRRKNPEPRNTLASRLFD